MAQYADAKIWIALKTHMELMPGGYTIIYQGETFDPPFAGGLALPHLIVTDFRIAEPRRFIGTGDSDEYRGQLDIAVRVPLDMSYENALGIVGTVQDHFAKGLLVSHDGVNVQVMATPMVINTGYRDGAYFRVPVTVPWRSST